MIVPNDDLKALRQAVETYRGVCDKLADELSEARWFLKQLDKHCISPTQRLWLDMQLGETWRAIMERAKRQSPKSFLATYKAPGE